MGIMSVVTDVGDDMDDEREPTWEEAMAALDTAAPVEVVRSPRQVTVVYRYTGGIFTATSPDVKDFRATGRSLSEVKRAARDDLERFLDPSVRIAERGPLASSGVCTAAAGRSRLKSVALNGVIVLSTSGTAGTFVSARVSPKRTTLYKPGRS